MGAGEQKIVVKCEEKGQPSPKCEGKGVVWGPERKIEPQNVRKSGGLRL